MKTVVLVESVAPAPTQKIIVWDDPTLDDDTIRSLYEMMFSEYELRTKRHESLTPQRDYCSYPTDVLDKRSSSISQAVSEVETAVAQIAGQRKEGHGRLTLLTSQARHLHG